jgi:hypothetical protein
VICLEDVLIPTRPRRRFDRWSLVPPAALLLSLAVEIAAVWGLAALLARLLAR